MTQELGYTPGDTARLRLFENIHAGKRAVIMGNGPSLNDMDLGFLADEIVIGVNKIYLGFEKFGFYPRYFVAVDDLVIDQSQDEIADISCVKFITSRAKGIVPPAPLTFHINTSHTLPNRFYHDITEGVREGHTVVHAALQIARYMGFAEVVIIGMDHRFDTTTGPNEVGHIAGEDPNHFCQTYYAGCDWNGPNLAESEVSYQAARSAYEAEGRRIIDATVNGACPTFEKADYTDLFNIAPSVSPPCATALTARMQQQKVTALSSAVALHHDAILAQQCELDKLYHSTSWRVTKPLRALRRGLGI